MYWFRLNDRENQRNISLHSRYDVKPLIPLHQKRTKESAANCYDSSLLIKDTDISDQREYTLVIENERGTLEGVVKLKVNFKQNDFYKIIIIIYYDLWRLFLHFLYH